MKTIALAGLLDRVASVLAADQLDLPGTDVPRDWSKWKPKSRYEGYDDPDVPQDRRDELAAAREEHIEQVIEIINRATERFAQSKQDMKENDTGDVFNRVDWSAFTEALDSYAHRRRLSPTHVFRTAESRLGSDIVADIMRGLAHVSSDKQSLVIDSYHDDESIADDIGEMVEIYTRPHDWNGVPQGSDWDELVDGLDEQDLKEVAAGIDANWTVKLAKSGDNVRGPVHGPVTVRINVDVYYGIDDIQSLEERFDAALSEQGGEFGFDDKPVTRQLPAGATADQLALLRWFELQGVESVKGQDLRRDPIARLPYVKSLLDQHRVLTPDIVRNTPEVRPANALAVIQREAKYSVNPFTMGVQVMFEDLPNWAFVVSITPDTFKQAFGVDRMPDETTRYMHNPGGHPSAGQDRLTIGWVRFTEFGQDLWIDEVQTDLMRGEEAGRVTLPEDLQAKMGGFTPFYRWLIEQFIREMRARGYNRFFMPNLRMKHDLYDASPPPSIYEEVPPKVRFHRTDVEINFDTTTINQVKPDAGAFKQAEDVMSNLTVYRVGGYDGSPPGRFGYVSLDGQTNSWWLMLPSNHWYRVAEDGRTESAGGSPPANMFSNQNQPNPVQWSDVPEPVREAWKAIRDQEAKTVVVLPDEPWLPFRYWVLNDDGDIKQELTRRTSLHDNRREVPASEIPAQTKPVMRDRLIELAYRAAGHKIGQLGRQRNMWVLASKMQDRLEAVAGLLARLDRPA